jgi:hypothetical protein
MAILSLQYNLVSTPMKRLALALMLSCAIAGAQAQQCTLVPGAPSITPLTPSATGGAGVVSATLTGQTGRFTYLCGFTVTTVGATTAANLTLTISGVPTTMSFAYIDPSSGQGFLGATFQPCLPSSGSGTSIVVTKPAATNSVVSAVNAWGCLQ